MIPDSDEENSGRSFAGFALPPGPTLRWQLPCPFDPNVACRADATEEMVESPEGTACFFQIVSRVQSGLRLVFPSFLLLRDPLPRPRRPRRCVGRSRQDDHVPQIGPSRSSTGAGAPPSSELKPWRKIH